MLCPFSVSILVSSSIFTSNFCFSITVLSQGHDQNGQLSLCKKLWLIDMLICGQPFLKRHLVLLDQTTQGPWSLGYPQGNSPPWVWIQWTPGWCRSQQALSKRFQPVWLVTACWGLGQESTTREYLGTSCQGELLGVYEGTPEQRRSIECVDVGGRKLAWNTTWPKLSLLLDCDEDAETSRLVVKWF